MFAPLALLVSRAAQRKPDGMLVLRRGLSVAVGIADEHAPLRAGTHRAADVVVAAKVKDAYDQDWAVAPGLVRFSIAAALAGTLAYGLLGAILVEIVPGTVAAAGRPHRPAPLICDPICLATGRCRALDARIHMRLCSVSMPVAARMRRIRSTSACSIAASARQRIASNSKDVECPRLPIRDSSGYWDDEQRDHALQRLEGGGCLH